MKKHFTFLIFFTLLTGIVSSQTYQVGHLSKSFTDVSRSNRSITTEIYYPANTAGDNVAIASGQFPILVFGHGFVMAWSSYDVVWNAVVPNGYIIVFPTTETSISPSHTDFGKDIAFLVGAMKAEGTNSSSFFYNSVTNKSAVMGHSMGGGSAFLAVQYDQTITALATLAAAVTNPSSTTAARSITIPAIVFSGVNDCVAPPATNQIPMYDTLVSSCKTLINITGGAHCQFASVNTSCYFGQGTCTPQATISAATQQTTTFNLLIPWLNFYLKNSCTSATQFQGLITAAAGITSAQNCTLHCTNIGIQNQLLNTDISIFPNPMVNETTISFSESQHNTTIKIIDVLGKEIKSETFSGKEFILEKETLGAGIYFVSISDENKNVVNRKIVVE